jgi:hypothetical protein
MTRNTAGVGVWIVSALAISACHGCSGTGRQPESAMGQASGDVVGEAVPAGPITSDQVALLPSFEVEVDAPGGLSHVPAVVFTPDGSALFVVTAQGELIEFQSASRELVHRVHLSEEPIRAVSLDREARVVVWLSAAGALEARALDAEGAPVQARCEGIDASALSVSPDGSLLAVAQAEEVVLLHLPSLDEAQRGRAPALDGRVEPTATLPRAARRPRAELPDQRVEVQPGVTTRLSAQVR